MSRGKGRGQKSKVKRQKPRTTLNIQHSTPNVQRGRLSVEEGVEFLAGAAGGEGAGEDGDGAAPSMAAQMA